MSSQFDTLCQESRLHLAWNIVKARGAAGGIDGVTLINITITLSSTNVQIRDAGTSC